MQSFEFLMIVVSIIVGLGITQLLAGIVRILRVELKPYWIHELWVFYVFLSLLQYCWSLFDLEARSDWIFVELLGLLTPPVILYLVASLLFPPRSSEPDLSDFYYAHRKPIFGLLAFLLFFYSAQGCTSAKNPVPILRAVVTPDMSARRAAAKLLMWTCASMSPGMT